MFLVRAVPSSVQGGGIMAASEAAEAATLERLRHSCDVGACLCGGSRNPRRTPWRPLSARAFSAGMLHKLIFRLADYVLLVLNRTKS